MPLNPSGLANGFIAPAIVSTGNIGLSVKDFSQAVAIGLCTWLQASVVTSVDGGTAGGGTTIMPLILPNPLMLGGLTTGFASNQLIGIRAPQLIQGLATGICLGLLSLAILNLTHSSVGVGSGVAKLVPAGSAVPFVLMGFTQMGLIGVGPPKYCQAIGQGIDQAFSSWTQPIVIVGSPSIVGSSGVGIGKVI